MKKLTITSLKYIFPGEFSPVINNLNIQVNEGSITALIGNNGTGKTTLMKTILGIYPPTEGEILWIDHDKGTSNGLEKSNVAYLPQNESINPQLLVDEVILLGRLPFVGSFSQPSDEDIEMVNKAKDYLSLSDFSLKKIGNLSGGELQRVRIARAIAQEADLILLDEPLTHLDIFSKKHILSLIRDLRASGKTIIFSTHNPLEALKIADYAILISNDHTNLFGAVDRILTSEKVSQCLGVDVRFGLEDGQYYQVIDDL